jgi:hypothetical protein
MASIRRLCCSVVNHIRFPPAEVSAFLFSSRRFLRIAGGERGVNGKRPNDQEPTGYGATDAHRSEPKTSNRGSRRRAVYLPPQALHSKNPSYDERGNPHQRTKLKLQKLVEQKGKCAYPRCPTPDRLMTKEDEPELDRIEAIKRYTKENTVLVHHDCHRISQREKGARKKLTAL